MQNKAKKESTPLPPSENKDSNHGNKPSTSTGNHSSHRKSPGTSRRSSSQEKPSKKDQKTEVKYILFLNLKKIKLYSRMNMKGGIL
jgi:hypothetical protein